MHDRGSVVNGFSSNLVILVFDLYYRHVVKNETVVRRHLLIPHCHYCIDHVNQKKCLIWVCVQSTF